MKRLWRQNWDEIMKFWCQGTGARITDRLFQNLKLTFSSCLTKLPLSLVSFGRLPNVYPPPLLHVHEDVLDDGVLERELVRRRNLNRQLLHQALQHEVGKPLWSQFALDPLHLSLGELGQVRRVEVGGDVVEVALYLLFAGVGLSKDATCRLHFKAETMPTLNYPNCAF
jgi:hypothetical protein